MSYDICYMFVWSHISVRIVKLYDPIDKWLMGKYIGFILHIVTEGCELTNNLESPDEVRTQSNTVRTGHILEKKWDNGFRVLNK